MCYKQAKNQYQITTFVKLLLCDQFNTAIPCPQGLHLAYSTDMEPWIWGWGIPYVNSPALFTLDPLPLFLYSIAGSVDVSCLNKAAFLLH